MGDKVICRAVLHPRDGREYLLVTTEHDGSDYRDIPVRPKGTPRTTSPEWEYEYKGGDELHMTPSLLCEDSQFHTDLNWTVKFERLPPGDGRDAMTFFDEINVNRGRWVVAQSEI